jgi:arabinan endo-1,5-alpha-L-arabinosidase
LPKIKGVQDFYLTAEGLGGETLVGNIKFGKAADSSSVGLYDNPRVASAAHSGLNITFDRGSQTIYLSMDAPWSLFDMNGVVIKSGFGREIHANAMPRGLYFIRSGNQGLRFRL